MDSESAESPQALAKIAREISDLVRTARAAVPDAAVADAPLPDAAKAHASPVASSRAVVAPAALPAGRVTVLECEYDQLQREVADLRQRWAGLDSGLPTTIGSPRVDGVSTPGVSACGGQCNSSFVFPGGPRPLDVSSLLASIESRECALRTQVQQLAEEKSAQQQQMEEEIASLRRANDSMREELRDRQERAPTAVEQAGPDAEQASTRAPTAVEQTGPDAEQASTVFRESPLSQSIGTHEARSSSEKQSDWLPSAVSESAPVSQVATGESDSRMSQEAARRDVIAPESAPLAAVEALSSPNADREEFCRQLSEVRGEVSRCAEMLGLSNETREQGEVRQQLSTLSDEVLRTSRSLLDASQPLSQRNAEIAGIRRQLDFLQGQMPASPADFGGASRADPRPADMFDLRMEMSCLRADLAQFGILPLHVMSDVRAQIEALRHDLSDVVQHMPTYSSGPRLGRYPANATALKDRLSDLKTEVARMLQDPLLEGGSAVPETRARLGILLRELQELRAGAVAVVSATGDSIGTDFAHPSTQEHLEPVARLQPCDRYRHGSSMSPVAFSTASRPATAAALRGFSAPVDTMWRSVRTDRSFAGSPRTVAGLCNTLAAPQMRLSDIVQSSPADEPEDHSPSPAMQPPSRSRLLAAGVAPCSGALAEVPSATIGSSFVGRLPPGRPPTAGQRNQ